ncbi:MULTISPECIES: GNAT family N-acetyltransferase [unclassified Streptomyces]|uniref:GNAT family N-acetyltransferase n=1 Tax=unclassified Streptomyces TaxID=2593676 RepID=UPI001BE8A006|nr:MULTISPECIES: GNAT family N-acetyltransferase [unclassified Streptomyces]MBT2407374.1 GNAT family N-acetyltransferase [Streptomyces sp. ISL-21]MBT2455435.1 GNAT family N-acetyltransferase [Streptomyces sp. ISL-86]MBT2611053.1 GNAT family N-acetyltransferase [Streptomyces sp. ISL-87]
MPQLPRPAEPADIPELIRLRAVALDSLGVDPGPADAAWRQTAYDWFGERMGGRADVHCLVVGGAPGEPLLATGMAWVTYHLPSPQWTDGRRGYLDGIVTDEAARGRGHGRRIVDGLVAWLNDTGIHYIQLHASADGEPVYKAAGFVTGRYPGMDLFTTPTA